MSEQTDLGYGQLLAVLWRRRFWFLGVFLTVFSVAILVALRKEPTYASYMQLLVEPNYQSKQGGGGAGEGAATTFTENNVQIDYATQLSLMRSSGLIRKALDKLSNEYPHLTIDDIKNNLTLSQKLENETATKIFYVEFTTGDPIKTQKILRAIQEVYQEYNLEQQKKRLSDGLSFINRQLPLARQSLLRAEANLKQFRTVNNLIVPENEATALVSQIGQIEQQRETIRAQYRETQVRYNLLKGNIARPPQENLLDSSRLSQSSRYQNLLTSIQQTEIALAEQRAILKESHPVVQDLLEKRQNLQQLLQQEKERVLGKKLPVQSKESLQKEGQLSPTDLDLVNNLVTAQLDLQGLQARDRSLAQTEQQLRAELNRFPRLISEYNRLLQEVEVKRTTLQQLLQAQQTLGIEINRGGFNWQVVESPQVGEKVGPDTTKDLLLGGVVALFLAGIAAFLREAMDDSIHTSDQIERQGVLPLLGATPKWRQPEVRRAGISLPWHLSPDAPLSILSVVQWQPFRESLDLIYKTIQLLKPSSTLKSLAVTSALAGEGKSTLILGLALSAGRLHQRVLVIDANLRQPTLHQLFELPNDVGLASLLAGETERPVPHALSFAGSKIDLLTAGPKPKDPVKLLTSRRMEELMNLFEQTYDLILLDTPAILGMVDAIQIASQAKGTILVGRLDLVTQSELAQASDLLTHLSPIGIVANGAREVMSSYLPVEQNGALQLKSERVLENLAG
jgi:capsular exopolysaccharide synthesis family protein